MSDAADASARGPGEDFPVPTFFESPEAFRACLSDQHQEAKFLWVGFWKKTSGRRSITWPEAVDEALCYGWIDGVRKSIDGESYAIRFSPRNRRSVWSAVNIERVRVLTELGRMQRVGLAAFEARMESRSGIYSHEQLEVILPEADLQRFREIPSAWGFYERQSPSYRKASAWWILSAKKEATRRRRFESLLSHSARGQILPQFTRKKSSS